MFQKNRKLIPFSVSSSSSSSLLLCPWQACHIEGGSAGLIPSQLLEEKRKAFVKRDLELATAGTGLSRLVGWLAGGRVEQDERQRRPSAHVTSGDKDNICRVTSGSAATQLAR